jgi:hypothetical protein
LLRREYKARQNRSRHLEYFRSTTGGPHKRHKIATRVCCCFARRTTIPAVRIPRGCYEHIRSQSWFGQSQFAWRGSEYQHRPDIRCNYRSYRACNDYSWWNIGQSSERFEHGKAAGCYYDWFGASKMTVGGKRGNGIANLQRRVIRLECCACANSATPSHHRLASGSTAF